MVSIFLKEPVYITTREVIDSTKKTAMIPYENVINKPLQTDAIIGDILFLDKKNFDNSEVENIIIKTDGTTLGLGTDYDVFVDDGTLGKDGYTYIEILTTQTGDITADYKVIESDESLKILIYKAQREIDAFLGKTFWCRYEETQEFLFPVNKDGNLRLPDLLKEATLYVVEQVYESGDTVSQTIGGGEVKRETTGPHTIEYSTGKYVIGSLTPHMSIKLLNKFKNIFNPKVI